MKVLLVGGGTLGSVNPLLACWKELHTLVPESSVTFWGRRQGIERAVVRAAGVRYSWIPAGKHRQYFSLQNVVDIVIIACAVVVSWIRLLVHRPSAIVTAGSYVAVPVAWAAASLGIPIVLYQQDMQVGLANRLIARVAKVRTAALPVQVAAIPGGAEAIGFVLRTDLLLGKAERAAANYGLELTKPTVMLIGGSSGSRDLNQAFLAALPNIPNSIQILHITGEEKGGTVSRPGYVAIPFTNENLPDVYALATVVITRAGMNVLAELVALGKPAIIVPLPDTHQEQNAAALAKRGAMVLSQASCTPDVLSAAVIRACTDAAHQVQLKSAVANMWPTTGAKILAQRVQKLV